ncbi:hypothetical protein AAG570_003527 [Ranatra chinensis]|uniref:Uncharacterized protein n=1 Tax=Ranatra chinensis TaxID=642074 RepID=A0ABD0Y4K7_9HEMI
MDVPIIRTESYEGEGSDDARSKKKRRNTTKYEFRGSQSHRCSLITIKDGDSGRTTVRWSSVRTTPDRKPSSANGGFKIITSPTNADSSPPSTAKEVSANFNIKFDKFERIYKEREATIGGYALLYPPICNVALLC